MRILAAAPQGGERSVVLQPGRSRLSFQVTVLKQGLYTLKHVHARLGRLSLRLRTALPEEEGPPIELLTAGPVMSASSEAQTLAQQPAIGDIDALGELLPPVSCLSGDLMLSRVRSEPGLSSECGHGVLYLVPP